MAGDQWWVRDVRSFSPESRDAAQQLKQGELRQSVRGHLYVWQVVCPPRHHTLEASPLQSRDSPTICLCRGSSGQIRGVYGASQTQKTQTGERRAPPTPALMVESALAPPSAMEYSSCVLRGPELPVTGATPAISYPILIYVPVQSRYLRRPRLQRYISKNNTLRPMRPVRLTHLTPEH